jgi:hypothetical protein
MVWQGFFAPRSYLKRLLRIFFRFGVSFGGAGFLA